MRINHLAVEVTRKCNLNCKHCLRGDAQCVDIDLRYIDMLLEQTTAIGHLCFTGGEPSLNVPAIRHFVDICRRRFMSIDSFYIATNGIAVSPDFVQVCLDLYNWVDHKEHSWLDISNDIYHIMAGKYDDSLLRDLPFYKKRHIEEGDDLTFGHRLHSEGRAITNYPEIATKTSTPQLGVTYLNVYGYIIDGCDWSYANQEKHKSQFPDFQN